MSVVSTVTELARPVAEAEGVELWDVEFKKEGPDYFLRVFIDKDGGVSINDCENVSRKLDVLLDEVDPIDCSYILEVSSAGLVRDLKTDAHLKKFINNTVELRLFKAVDGTKKISGTLEGFDADNIFIETADGKKNFCRKDVSKVTVDLV